MPGSHGGAEVDGSPLVQYDLKTGKRKVICFLADYCRKWFGFIPQGSYCSAVSGDGSQVMIIWMGNRGATDEEIAAKKKIKFNTCALTIVNVPESERR